MIKLGIFGDSFADDYHLWLQDGFQDVGPSYIDHIRFTGKYDVENYGLGGSTVAYSKFLFDKHYHKYDKILFIVSSPTLRLWLRYFQEFERKVQFLNTGYVAEKKANMLKYPKRYTDFEKRCLEAAEQYFITVEDEEYLLLANNLMIEDIMTKSPHTILIPAFRHSILDYTHSTLNDIAQKEQDYFKIDFIPCTENFYDARKCHLCEENNEILAKKMLEILDGAPVQFDINDFVDPPKDFTHYFRPNPWVFQ